MLARGIFTALIALAACGHRDAERTEPFTESASAVFKNAWSESPPCYIPDPDAGPSRFDQTEGQFVIRPCPPDVVRRYTATLDAGTSDAGSPSRIIWNP